MNHSARSLAVRRRAVTVTEGHAAETDLRNLPARERSGAQSHAVSSIRLPSGSSTTLS